MKIPKFETSGQHRELTFDGPVPESKRTYIFPGGDTVTIEKVVKTKVSRHGNHMLFTEDGTVHVIAWGWLALSYPAESDAPPLEVSELSEVKGNFASTANVRNVVPFKNIVETP